jgi:hypothetical protein
MNRTIEGYFGKAGVIRKRIMRAADDPSADSRHACRGSCSALLRHPDFGRARRSRTRPSATAYGRAAYLTSHNQSAKPMDVVKSEIATDVPTNLAHSQIGKNALSSRYNCALALGRVCDIMMTMRRLAMASQSARIRCRNKDLAKWSIYPSRKFPAELQLPRKVLRAR